MKETVVFHDVQAAIKTWKVVFPLTIIENSGEGNSLRLSNTLNMFKILKLY